jgi:hypothetical protein
VKKPLFADFMPGVIDLCWNKKSRQEGPGGIRYSKEPGLDFELIDQHP